MTEVKRYVPGNIWSFLSKADLFSKENITKKEVGVSIVDEIILVILSCYTISSFYISGYLKNNNASLALFAINIGLVSARNL